MAARHTSTEIGNLIRKISHYNDTADSVHGDEAARTELLHASRKLTALLEKPGNIPLQTSLLPIHTMCVRVAVDLKLFNLIFERAQGGYLSTADELAKASGAETLLIVRLMRVLLELGFASEKDVNTYGITSLTVAMTKPSAQANIIHKQALMVPLAKLPEYLKFNAYKCPSDSRNGPVQYAFGTSKPTWEYWESIPGVMENFNTFMSGVRGATASWVKWFPIKERLINGAKGGDKEVFMIDVGGGRGHNLLEVKTKFPEAGRYILQDLPSVVEDVGDLDKDIERMGIDMFEAQPVKGSRVYYFHFVFHDWSDESSRTILRNTAAAMERGYSKLIIGDYILPNTGAPLEAASLDLAMMTYHSSMERSEQQWRDLLDSAGLQLTRVWPPPGMGDGIIEAMLKA